MPEDGSFGSGEQNRRTMLKVVGGTGVAALSGLAGCSSGNGSGSSSQSTSSSSSMSSSSSSSSTSASASSSASASASVKVGFLHPLSGPYAGLGKAQQKGAKIAVDHVNNDLGGINGKKVKAIYEDTTGDPSTGRSKAKKLVESNGVDVLIGGLVGAVALSVEDYAYGAKTVYFPYGGTERITGSKCKPTTFRYENSVGQGANAGSQWALNKFGKNVWVHHSENSFGQSINKYWQQSIKSANANIVGVTKTKVGASDFSSYINQIQSSKADWLLMAFSGSMAINFLKQAQQYGLPKKVKIMSTVNGYQPLRQGAGDALLNTYALIRYSRHMDNAENKKLVKAHTKAYGYPPNDFAAVMWSSLLMYAKGVENAGSTATKKVIPALEGLTMDLPMGSVKMRACDHQALRDLPVGGIVKGSDYKWPDLKVDKVQKGADITRPCSQTNCNMPSL